MHVTDIDVMRTHNELRGMHALNNSSPQNKSIHHILEFCGVQVSRFGDEKITHLENLSSYGR